ncbi:MAG: efflux RND transporter periplasmic adaptor subunit [Thermodesulfobacteriota bacterium]
MNRPKFRQDLQASEQSDRHGRKIVVLKDPVSDKYFRLSADELRVLKTFDGTRTVDEALDELELTGHYYGSDEARTLLGKASRMGLMLGTEVSSAQFQRQMKAHMESAKRSARFSSIYFLFIPLVNPDRFLAATLPFVKNLCNRWTGRLVALLAPGAIYLLVSGMERFDTEYLFFFNWENLLYLWITIALTKLVHEFAHAYTAKSFGLHVPQMGLAFLIFLPCLYCNTTDAWQLADRKERIGISAAGIIAEATLAILCVYIWYFTKPGVVNSLAFYLMALSFVSTLLFNGNPLMKFDGYFILIDVLGIPNLQQKSFAHIRYLFMNRVLGIASYAPTPLSPGDAALFTVYGVSAFLYRIFLYTGIVAGVYYRFDKFIGIVLASFACALFVVRPVVKGIRTMMQKGKEMRPRLSGVLVSGCVVGLALIALCIPVSSRSVYPCYLDAARVQKLVVPLQTSVSEVRVKEGDAVKAGQLLFRLDTTRLDLNLANKEIERSIKRKEMELVLLDPEKMGQAPEKLIEMSQLDHEIRILKKNLAIARETIVAPFDGVVTKLDYRAKPGFEPGEGVVVGDLEMRSECLVKTVVAEMTASRISKGQAIEIWFPVGAGRRYSATIDEVKPFSEKTLTQGPLSSRVGGEVATEAKSREEPDAPLEAQYVFSSRFSNQDGLPLRMAGKSIVSFAPESMLSRLIREAAQAFNRESIF